MAGIIGGFKMLYALNVMLFVCFSFGKSIRSTRQSVTKTIKLHNTMLQMSNHTTSHNRLMIIRIHAVSAHVANVDYLCRSLPRARAIRRSRLSSNN